MARGRPFVTGVPVGVFTFHRRAASLPADESRLSRSVTDFGADAQKASIIASHAVQDTNDIVASSRRHDRDFLHDVATKLANINTIKAAPAQNDASSIVRSRPPRSPRSAPVRSQPLVGIHRSALSPDEHLEIAAYLQRQPSTPSRRSASVPPGLSRSRPSVPRWFPSSAAYYGRSTAGYGVPATVPTGLPPLPLSTTHLPTDSVVGVAHTSHYGDIVIGIPHHKRFMFNAQHDSDTFDTQSLPPVHLHVPTRVSSAPAHFHSTAATSHTRSLAQPYSRASYAGPFTVSDVGVITSGGDVDDVISIKSYPSTAARTSRRTPKTVDIEEDIANSIFGNDIAPPVRSASVAKDYKAVLSRYVPSNGPKIPLTSLSNNELDRKYGQILTSMQPRMSATPSVPSSITQHREYSHSSLPPPGPQKPTKPPMSDARKKLRQLLCRSKGNPRYFDDE